MGREIGDRTTPFYPRINFTRSHEATKEGKGR